MLLDERVKLSRQHMEWNAELAKRIQQAKSLLANPAMSVTQIGLNLGFSETSSFTTTFRKHTGLTPTAYRRTLE